jgi:hypothetical protein
LRPRHERAIATTGRTDGGPERNMLVLGVHSSVEAASRDERLVRFVPRDLLETTPYVLIGDADALVDGLQERRDRWGLTYFACWADQIKTLIPALRRLAA